jgi:hypothetical protein
MDLAAVCAVGGLVAQAWQLGHFGSLPVFLLAG